MSRWRSILLDLMTVRAVMVRAALKKKKALQPDSSGNIAAVALTVAGRLDAQRN